MSGTLGTHPKGDLLATVKAVGWSFLGIRRRAGLDHDVQRLNPVHVIVVGVAGAALFVVLLVVLIRWIISSGVAA